MGKLKKINNLTTLIIAAGVGKRMGKVGKDTPKCLLKLNNFTVIERILNQLKSLGIRENIYMIIGYKSEMIINYLKKKNFNIKFIKIDNYRKGHSYTFYYFKRFWNKISSKSLIFLHADIVFDRKFLKNIIYSKKKNLIGIKKSNYERLKSNVFHVRLDQDCVVKEINLKKNLKNKRVYGEIIGVNKFSRELLNKIFRYMQKRFKIKKNQNLSWEILINSFIQLNKNHLFALKKQNFKWININRIKDYKIAKNMVKNI